MEHSPGQTIYQATKQDNKFKNSEIISSIFSNHNGIQLEINYKKKTGKFTNMQKVNMLLNNQQVKEEIKKYLETNENGNTTYKTYRMQQKQL